MNGKIAILITGLLLSLNNKHYSHQEVIDITENHLNSKYETDIDLDKSSLTDITDKDGKLLGYALEDNELKVVFIENSDEILGVTGYKIYDNLQSDIIENDLKEELSLYGIDCEYIEPYTDTENLYTMLNSCYNMYYNENLDEIINEDYKEYKRKREYDIGSVDSQRAGDIPDILMNLKYKVNLNYESK